MKTKVEEVRCCGCQEILDRNVKDFYGTYCFESLIEGVCFDCYGKGIRTEAQKKGNRGDNSTNPKDCR